MKVVPLVLYCSLKSFGPVLLLVWSQLRVMPLCPRVLTWNWKKSLTAQLLALNERADPLPEGLDHVVALLE